MKNIKLKYLKLQTLKNIKVNKILKRKKSFSKKLNEIFK